MEKLPYDCVEVLFRNFLEEMGGIGLLCEIALVSRKVRHIKICMRNNFINITVNINHQNSKKKITISIRLILITSFYYYYVVEQICD